MATIHYGVYVPHEIFFGGILYMGYDEKTLSKVTKKFIYVEK